MSVVQLSQHTIDEILSGCPLLEFLNLGHSKGFSRLEILGRSFSHLFVTTDYSHNQHLEEISAPHMRYLSIKVRFGSGLGRSRRMLLENVSSLQGAHIDFFDFDSDSKSAHEIILYADYFGFDWKSISMDEMKRYTMTLLQDLRHVANLELGDRCTKVVTMMSRDGCQFPQFKAKSLWMGAATDVRSMYGVLAMLESSPYLEELNITSSKQEEEESIHWDDPTLNCDLLHLKTVTIQLIISSDLWGEPIFTLIQILLKRAPLLEKMVIHDYFGRLSAEEADLLKETLLNYPKSSQKVSFEICDD